MKKLVFLSVVLMAFAGVMGQGQKASPPATATETTTNGVTITINYSQPALKGRTIGKEVAPYGRWWRTGANEKTSFEVSKDVKVEGQALPAGKYHLVTIPNENEWVIIFNSNLQGWGTQYDESSDVLRVTVKPGKTETPSERMTFHIAKNGLVSLLWGNEKVSFKVE